MQQITLNTNELTETQKHLIEEFCKAARANGHYPITCQQLPHIGVWLKDGTDIPALAIYEDDLGNWVMLSAKDNHVRQYLHNEVL